LSNLTTDYYEGKPFAYCITPPDGSGMVKLNPDYPVLVCENHEEFPEEEIET
jgi:hypothetical protein